MSPLSPFLDESCLTQAAAEGKPLLHAHRKQRRIDDPVEHHATLSAELLKQRANRHGFGILVGSACRIKHKVCG